MTQLDDRLRPRIAALITKYGVQVSYTARTPGYTPSTSTGAPTASTTKNLFVTPPDRYSLFFTDGVQVQRGDCRVFLADYNLGFTPHEGDKIANLNGREWTVIDPKRHATGEHAGLWELQLR